MPKFNRKLKIAAAIICMVAILIIANLTAGERSNITVIEKFSRDLVAPIKSGAMVIYDFFSLVPQFFTRVDTLLDENAALKEDIAALENQLSFYKEEQLENVYLKKMLALSDEMGSWEPVATSVIGRSSASWYNTITIKGGENRGFKKNMPVITTEGLVGRIINVSKFTSEVLLLTDTTSAVGAMVQISNIPGIAEGNSSGESLNLLHIPYGSWIMKDQVVVTSGLGGVFPKGLRIGYIEEIKPDNGELMLEVKVRVFADFERLDYVLVLTNLTDVNGETVT